MGRRAPIWSKDEINQLYREFELEASLPGLEEAFGRPATGIAQAIIRFSKDDPAKPGRVWDKDRVAYYRGEGRRLYQERKEERKKEEDSLERLVQRRLADVDIARRIEAEIERRVRIELRVREMVGGMSGMQGLELGYDIKRMDLGPKGGYLVIRPKYDLSERNVVTRENFKDHVRRALKALEIGEFYKSFIVSVLKGGEVKVSTRKQDRTEELGCFLRAYERILRRE